MSSTTRPSERGQTLVLFALSLVVLIGFAAMAFDVGQWLLERRSEQNAADAAALAGARYIIEPGCKSPSPSPATCSAFDEARRVAGLNGYTSGADTTVTVSVPPAANSQFSGRVGYVQVEISRARPSLFAGVLGIIGQRPGAMATASNLDGVAASFSMLALDPSICQSANFSGGGLITVGGGIQVNSNNTCPQGAFSAGGTTDITIVSTTAAQNNVVGSARCAGNSVCSPAPNTGQPSVPDPLAALPAPVLPALTPDAASLSGMAIPSGCPGGTPEADAKAPMTCVFNNGGTWVLSAGYYPGGISILNGTVLLRPGLYYLGGGGLNLSGSSAKLYSISAGWSSSLPPTTCTTDSFADCGGVLFYNTNDPDATSGGSTVKDLQKISLNGSDTVAKLYPIQNAGPYTNIIVFQDRNLSVSPGAAACGNDVEINGSGANMTVVGTIYVPSGCVSIEATGDLGTSQVIADTFAIAGSGTLSVGYDADVLAQLKAVGLVE